MQNEDADGVSRGVNPEGHQYIHVSHDQSSYNDTYTYSSKEVT